MYGMFQSSEMCRNRNLWMDPNIQQAAAAAVAINAAASFNAMQKLPSFGQLGPTTGLSDSQLNHNNSNHQQQTNIFGELSHETMNSTVQSPQNVTSNGIQRHGLRSYSQSTASTSHTPQSTGPPSQCQATAVSPPEGQSVCTSCFINLIPKKESNFKAIRLLDYSQHQADQTMVSTPMEELSELDLQDFEDLLMDKPSTSVEPPSQSHPTSFLIASELAKTNYVEPGRTVGINQQPLQYRADELASADFELDRLVSLVASQNCGRSQPQQSKSTITAVDGSSTREVVDSKTLLAPSSSQIALELPQVVIIF